MWSGKFENLSRKCQGILFLPEHGIFYPDFSKTKSQESILRTNGPRVCFLKRKLPTFTSKVNTSADRFSYVMAIIDCFFDLPI